jgi:outer membrane protein OmpA-like peptidoglycan-associated protein
MRSAEEVERLESRVGELEDSLAEMARQQELMRGVSRGTAPPLTLPPAADSPDARRRNVGEGSLPSSAQAARHLGGAPRANAAPNTSAIQQPAEPQASPLRNAQAVPERRPSLATVYFQASKLSTKGEMDRVLRNVRSVLRRSPNGRFTIVGHSSNDGTEDENMRLSAQRASVVADFLKQNGLSSDQLTIIAMGSALPIATNSTLAGRRYNRRVEIFQDAP